MAWKSRETALLYGQDDSIHSWVSAKLGLILNTVLRGGARGANCITGPSNAASSETPLPAPNPLVLRKPNPWEHQHPPARTVEELSPHSASPGLSLGRKGCKSKRR